MPADALAGVEPVPGVPKPDPILIADGITRRFGGLTAVDVDHVEIQRGLITALIGPNGAGKTTFFNLLTGYDQPDSGRWTFDGNDMSDLAAYKVARLGMEIGRAHVRTPVTNAHPVCRLHIEKKNNKKQ